MTGPVRIGEHSVGFERRRYGTRSSPVFYTWVYLQVGADDWASLGDPWPVLNPKRAEILEAIDALQARNAAAEESNSNQVE